VTLEFSEPLDPSLSKARLVDEVLTPIVEGPGQVDPDDRRILRLELPALGPGAYSVLWQARSAVDGHITTGSVSFTVGRAASVSLLGTAEAVDPATAMPSPIEILLRWLTFAAASLTAGPLIFGLLVWRPAFRSEAISDAQADKDAGVVLSRLVVLAVSAFAALTVASVLFQAWQASRSALPTPFSTALLSLLSPGSGWVIWVRLAFLVALDSVVGRLPPPGSGRASLWMAASGLGILAGLTLSLLSHGAARANVLAVAADGLHVAGMAAWIGGLPPLYLLIRRKELPAAVLVPRFSRMAVGAVVVLAVSGTFAAVVEVGSLQALISTTYGRSLLLKVLGFLVLVGFGAVNLLWLTPRLSRSGGSATARLRSNIAGEMVTAAVVLALAGLLTASMPAREAVEARDRMGFVGEFVQDGLWIRLWVAPAQVGVNDFAVDVIGGYDPSNMPRVLLRLATNAARLGVTEVEANRISDTRYLARGSYLTVAGTWEIDVIVRRSGHDDVRRVFPLVVAPNPLAAALENPVPATADSLQQGADLYQIHCLPCHGIDGRGDGPAGLRMNPPPADLTVHTVPGVHPDGQLFEWITNGYPGSVMPAFDEILTEAERWHLVNFIRTLGTP
jgi:copper transport protein